jgi:hypothetical protein
VQALRQAGYLAANNPLAERVLIAVLREIASGVRQSWVPAFLSLPTEGTDGKEEIVDEYGENVTQSMSPRTDILEALIRQDKDGLDNPVVLGNWLRFGLNARVQKIAEMSDCSTSLVSRIKSKWEHELRATLNDLRILGISGEDLYQSAVFAKSVRVINLLKEIRAARNADDTAPCISSVDKAMHQAWFEYRVQASLKGIALDSMSIHPPKWFVREFSEA